MQVFFLSVKLCYFPTALLMQQKCKCKLSNNCTINMTTMGGSTYDQSCYWLEMAGASGRPITVSRSSPFKSCVFFLHNRIPLIRYNFLPHESFLKQLANHTHTPLSRAPFLWILAKNRLVIVTVKVCYLAGTSGIRHQLKNLKEIVTIFPLVLLCFQWGKENRIVKECNCKKNIWLFSAVTLSRR